MKFTLILALTFAVFAHKTIEDIEEGQPADDPEPETDPNQMPAGFTDPPKSTNPGIGRFEKIKQFFSHRPDWYWEHFPMETLFVILFIVSILFHNSQKAVNQ